MSIELVESILKIDDEDGGGDIYNSRLILDIPIRDLDDIKDGLIGRASDAQWIIAIKHNHLTEEHIAEFSKECRRFRKRINIRICITPLEVDTNVRLKALEEKIWTWNLNNINLLFDLFNKPAIIP